MHKVDIIIIDFGSQFTKLIYRKLSEIGVRAAILSMSDLVAIKDVIATVPCGIVLSGGPFSAMDNKTDKVIDVCIKSQLPILAVCYGMQAICQHFNGVVSVGSAREFGETNVKLRSSKLFAGVPNETSVWMSHCDTVESLPKDFEIIGESFNGHIVAMQCITKRIYCVQFHPEAGHTIDGSRMLNNFAIDIAGSPNDWHPNNILPEIVVKVREQVGDKRVIAGVSGGVDSSVAAKILHNAVGDKLTCILIDNGLMRAGEIEEVIYMFRAQLEINLKVVDASDLFLSRLRGVIDPEQKRKIIGNTFIEVFEANTPSDVEFLMQGTLYPDVIESSSVAGNIIKSHHNVGGLPDKMRLKLIEPLRDLFKDEVRTIGKVLNIPDVVLQRHPFPGPGLSIRIIGEVTKDRIDVLRKADTIFINELKKAELYDSTWQAFVVLIAINAVGVKGDGRVYENVCAIRAVDSVDGMTASASKLDMTFLCAVANKIINEVAGISRMVYDITSKPPASIEWE